MSSPWQIYKQLKKDQAKPWHILSTSNTVDEEIGKKRMEICEQCPELSPKTKQCKQCGCFMVMKTKITLATCPLEKW